MTTRIVLLAAAIAGFSSCATYRSGQTPDDVYYSPARETEAYVETRRDDEGRVSYSNLEDRRIRQQIRDQRFRNFDDDFYWNNPRFSSTMGWNTWNNPWGWNSWGSNWNTWSLGWNSWNTWNNPFGWNTWNSPFVCIPGTTIIIPGPGAPKNSQGIRYSPAVQNYTNAGTRNFGGGKGGNYMNTNGGSRYFGGSSNNNSGRRSSFFNDFFGGGNSNGSYNNSNYGGSRTFGNGGSYNNGNSGGSRTFSNSGSSGGSSGGSKSSGSSGGGRRN